MKTRYAGSAFDGEGARLYGGRWTSPGVRVAYAAESTALAVLEVLVHLHASALLSSYSLASARIPRSLVTELDVDTLPESWADYPAPPEVQAIGDAWARARTSAVLRVPSVVAPGEHNFVLNVEHPDFARVELGAARPFSFDKRLLRGA